MPIEKLANAKYILIEEIKVGERLRQESSQVRKKIEEIAESIKELGPLQPVVLDDQNNLIDGGCRLAAYKLLGETKIPYVTRKNIDEGDKFMLEVEANLQRSDLTWQEKTIGISKYHKLKQGQTTKWTMAATGSLLGVSDAHVNNCLQVAPLLLKKDEEILNADSLKTALTILLERKRNQAINHRLATAPKGAPILTSSGVKEPVQKPMVFALGPKPSIAATPITKTLTTEAKPIAAAPAPEPAHRHTIDLASLLHNADCTVWMKQAPRDSVDVIVTDIPYGIDLDNMEDIIGIDQMRSTHQVEDNLELMPKFLDAAYHILKPNAYLIFFYALQHHEKLRDWGRDVGFSVQDWPLLWLKPHSCKNNAPHCNWTKSFEPCMVMRKGTPVLHTKMTKCHLEVDGIPDKKQQSNPFAKPLMWLNEMVFKPLALQQGAICLDPFAGEGSILTAAILNGLTPIGIELEPTRFPALVSRIQRLYKNVLNQKVDFILPDIGPLTNEEVLH